VNAKKLLKEEKEHGVANVSYFAGTCLTCEHSPDRDLRAACPRADFFSVTAYFSRAGDAKGIKHLCKNWLLCSQITSCFKKNQSVETTPVPQNVNKTKFQRK